MNSNWRRQAELQTQLLFPGEPTPEDLLREAQALADRMVFCKAAMIHYADAGMAEEAERHRQEWLKLSSQLESAKRRAGVAE